MLRCSAPGRGCVGCESLASPVKDHNPTNIAVRSLGQSDAGCAGKSYESSPCEYKNSRDNQGWPFEVKDMACVTSESQQFRDA